MYVKFRQWTTHPVPESTIQCLTEAGYPYLVSCVLASRGIDTVERAADFLLCEHQLSHSPLLMADMDRAVARISRAIADGERIAVYGDYDVDGITATVILVDYLKRHGADVVYYIPRRVEDGYGLNADAIRSLREQGVSLMVTVDCGITGVEEVAYAASLGIDTVVTDHHECKETLPDAAAVVDPHRIDCAYPFKHLAGCGVALKLVLALGGPDREEALFSRYCTLAAIGTIADVMQMSDENRAIVSRGLATIDHSDFIGLHALLREAGLADKAVTSVQIGFVLAPRINAAGRMGAADMAAALLLCDEPARAEILSRELCALNRERQSVEQEIYSQALEMIDTLPANERSALVLADGTWHQGVVGIVASRLSEKFSCPSFMIHLNGEVGKGSCRSWGGFNLFAALEACSDLLLGFGGHELAAGFTIEADKIPAFRRRINQVAREFRGGQAPVSSLDVDVVLTQPSRVTLEEVDALDALEPYGSGNVRPVFCLTGATLERAQNVGQNRHLKLRLTKGSAQFDGIFFSATADSCGCAVGSRVDAAFYLQVNEFRGIRSIQLQLVDLRPSLAASGREDEALQLLHHCLTGEPVQPKEAQRLMPSREQFVRSWRLLQHIVPIEGLTADYLPLLRTLSAALGGVDPFLRAAFCLEIFAERGLLSCRRAGDQVHLLLTDGGRKVDLESSSYLLRLRDILEKPQRGGGLA
ncbi:MAG: single-stranded-DNA-specific exonuclease RecJ [Ruminococcaceae bacterium]|jgi:single-stranded-DNA-specific exonuclease|nr:single-stranded-DNA-specific exonuclease RecJ [Oscillospiraceae bacterium]